MASLKIHLKLLLGEEGTPLSKLINITDKVQKFLTDVGKDLNMQIDPTKWVAKKFKSTDLNFDVEYPDEVDVAEKNNFNELMKNILGYDPTIETSKDIVGKNSIRSYFALRNVLERKEKVEVQLYDNGDEQKPSKYLIDGDELKSKFEEFEKLQFKITGEPRFKVYYGSVRGTITTIFLKKASDDDKPHIRVTDFTTNRVIKCFYDDSLYDKIHELIKSKDNAVVVEGLIKLKDEEDYFDTIDINKIDKIPEFQEGDWEKFFGKLPNLTDELTVKKYIDYIRGVNG